MSAMISHCGRYRYQLERHVGAGDDGFRIAFFGINPSTADHTVDDPTIRKLRGFSQRLAVDRFIVGNVFAYRATDVRELARVDDPVGPANAKHLDEIIQWATMLVPCWGRRDKVPPQLRHHIARLRDRLHDSGKPVWVFGLTACGSPLHPLMLPYSTSLVEWPR